MRHFEFEDGSSHKFWEVSIEGSSVTTRYGKVGSVGQTTVKEEGTPEKAGRLFERLIREKTGKGYVERTQDTVAAPTPKKLAKTKEEAETPVADFEGLRELALRLGKGVDEHNFDARLVFAFFDWAPDASDDTLLEWLSFLPAGAQAHAAGLVAVRRVLDGKEASARRFLAHGEATAPTEGRGAVTALLGLLPAWWRLEPKRAEKALPEARATLEEHQLQHHLCLLAALGGHAGLLDELLPDADLALVANDGLHLALLPLLRDGATEALETLLSTWQSQGADAGYLASQALLSELLRQARPERYVELVLAHDELLSDTTHLEHAVAAAEQANPKLAADLALQLLEHSFPSISLDTCGLLRLLVKHAPAKAEAWEAREPQRVAASPRRSKWLGRSAELAALGRAEAGRAGVAALLAAGEFGLVLQIARSLNDQALAATTLKQACDASEDHWAWALPLLRRLGEDAFVDARLEAEVTKAGALSAEARRKRVPVVALAAGTGGRLDLMTRALTLLPAAARSSAAQRCANDRASERDWSGAAAAFAIAKEGDDGRDFTVMLNEVIAPALRSEFLPLRWP